MTSFRSFPLTNMGSYSENQWLDIGPDSDCQPRMSIGLLKWAILDGKLGTFTVQSLGDDAVEVCLRGRWREFRLVRLCFVLLFIHDSCVSFPPAWASLSADTTPQRMEGENKETPHNSVQGSQKV